MMSGSRENTASFRIESWHSLTEDPLPVAIDTAREAEPAAPGIHASGTEATHGPHPALTGVSPDLIKLLYDILVYPYGSVRVRIKRLNMSARAFEKAKLEGYEKGFLLEATAGATIYLIPLAKTFDAWGFPCPYERNVSPEHSYFVGWGRHLLQQNPANKKIYTELKVGESSCTSDLVTVGHDGTRRAYEVTLSTGNVLSNVTKYTQTDFVQIVFLCRDYRLREAVKACCREGGLDADLLAKLEYMQFSTLLSRQRRFSL
jgi:hypothetical protein